MAQWSSDRTPLPADWERRRQDVFERDKWRCKLEYPGTCTGRASEVDHVGDRDDHRRGNLRAVCEDCHEVRTAAQRDEGTRKYWAQVYRPAGKHPGLL